MLHFSPHYRLIEHPPRGTLPGAPPTISGRFPKRSYDQAAFLPVVIQAGGVQELLRAVLPEKSRYGVRVQVRLDSERVVGIHQPGLDGVGLCFEGVGVVDGEQGRLEGYRQLVVVQSRPTHRRRGEARVGVVAATSIG